MEAGSGILECRVAELLEKVAARTPAPAGGSVAALTLALAAALAEMAARFSDDQWPDAPSAVTEASALRERATPLAQDDADAYGAVLKARRLAKDDPARKGALAASLDQAIAVPLEIARVAAKTAALARRVANHGNPRLRADALAAATLAASAARVAANLVATNLEEAEDDERVGEARRLAARAAAAVDG